MRQNAGNKSFFASFSSKEEEPSFFEKKEAKKLLFPVKLHVAGATAHSGKAARRKSLFASFSSEKEDSFFKT